MHTRLFSRVGRQIMVACLASLGFTTLASAATSEADATAASESSADNSGSLQEVVVTARKREESVIRAPVDINVTTAEQIRDQKISDLYDLEATVAPDIKVSNGFGSVGTVVYIRGIGSGDSATYVDQAVGLDLDGVSMSHGVFYNGGMFDVDRIEVLKGPQNLFYGKSTTAGIIAIHTADPTPNWHSEANVGWEFNAREAQFNGYIAGPITDQLGVRLAVYADDMSGYLFNPNPASEEHRLPRSETFGARATLKWDNSDLGLRARLKYGTWDTDTNGDASTINQGFSCPQGRRQNQIVQNYDDCRLDEYTQGFPDAKPYNPNVDWYSTLGNPAPFATGSPEPLLRNGRPYQKTRTHNGMLQLDYDILEGLTLTSVTGYSWVGNISTGSSGFGLKTPFYLAGSFEDTDTSEELRLTSNFKGPVNFTAGGLYHDSMIKNYNFAVLPTATVWGAESARQNEPTTSAFAQLIFTPFDKWEFDPGVRWTHVYRYFRLLEVFNNLGIPGNVGENQVGLIPSDQTRIAQNNVSPEVTITYHPTDNWTIYASYKQGYKGPGFNVQQFVTPSYNPAIAPNAVSPFGGERVRGEEGGVKAVLLDGHIDFALTPYYYNYTGLQVSNYNYVTHNIETTNGANARTYGTEFSTHYRPPAVSGLQLNGYVAFNRSEFTSFPLSPCWGGQTVAEGCIVDPTSGASVQNLAGRSPYQAPRWSGAVGATYATNVKNYGLSGGVNWDFSSSYFTVADLLPGSRQGSWSTIDASIRLSSPNNFWQVALIGRNLTNRLYVIGASDAGTVTPGVQGDAFGFTNRSRQVMIQVTARPM